jgi:hypothetical protein
MTERRKTRPKDVLTNHELVVLAAFLAGAQSSSLDTEDIAIKANELAPGRFSWRKYKDQINIDTVRKRLWDATKPETGAYLIGSEKSGWRLTKSGFDFAKQNFENISNIDLGRRRQSKDERASQNREIKRMQFENAFMKFTNGTQHEITKSEAERFFRLDDYVTGDSRVAKIERFKIIAADSTELLAAIDFLSGLVKEG